MALPTLLPARNAIKREGVGERSRKVPSIQNKMADVFFSVFRATRSRSFVLIQTFSLFLLLTDKTCPTVKVIYLLILVQFIFFLVR